MTNVGIMGALQHENVRLQGMMIQVLLLVTILVNLDQVSSFQIHLTSTTTSKGHLDQQNVCRSFGLSSSRRRRSHHVPLLATNDDNDNMKDGSSVEEYRNAAAEFLSKFMSKGNKKEDDPLKAIDFNVPKIPSTTTMETLAQALDYDLIQSEWFVTGNVNPRYVEFNVPRPEAVRYPSKEAVWLIRN